MFINTELLEFIRLKNPLSSVVEKYEVIEKDCCKCPVSYTHLDILLNTNYIRDAVCISFCLNELLSIVENTSLMGIPYPPAIKKAIDVLQTKIGRTEETTDKEEK